MLKKIEDLKVSCGIDTLYYYYDIDLTNYIEFYNEIQENIKNNIFKFDILDFLGNASGYSWYKFSDNEITIARIGFKNYNKQRHIKDIYVQLDGSSIYYYGLENTIKKVDNYLTKFLTIKSSHVSRIDLNIFTNTSFADLDTNWISTRSKSESQIFTILNGKKIETIYFGKRANGKVLRIYNKIQEIKSDLDSQKNNILMNKLQKENLLPTDLFKLDDTILWNIELELHRKFLKKNYSIDTLEDMFKNVYSIWQQETERFKILYKQKKYQSYLKSDKNKIPELPIWLELKRSYTYGKIFDIGIRNKQKAYKMTKQALFTQTLQLVSKYNSFQDDLELKLNIQDYVTQLIEFISYEQNKKDSSFQDEYKYIPTQIIDKQGLVQYAEYTLKPFYKEDDNE